tara:strand:+ start:108 stop:806 length:699 start_codon:yes stop_codon:yes gene_type:complete
MLQGGVCLGGSTLIVSGELRHLYLRHHHPNRKTTSELYTFARGTCTVLAAGLLARGLSLVLGVSVVWALVCGDLMTTALLSMLTALAHRAEESCALISPLCCHRLYRSLQTTLWATCAAVIGLRLDGIDVHLARGSECLLYLVSVGSRAVYLLRHLEAFMVDPQHQHRLRQTWQSLACLCFLLTLVSAFQVAQAQLPGADWGTTLCHVLAALYLQHAVKPLKRQPRATMSLQ